VQRWRFGLAIVSLAVFGVGLILDVGIFVLFVMPDNAAAYDLLERVPDPVYYGWPILIVLPIVAMIVRRRLPFIASRPPDVARIMEIVVHVVPLALFVAIAPYLLFSATSFAEQLVICSTQGC
jgi:hypothetical protein